MKANLFAIILGFAFIAVNLCGCSFLFGKNGGNDDSMIPAPVAIYLNNGIAFTDVATGTTFTNTATTGIYRMDGAGDYIYQGNIVDYSKVGWTIAVNGSTYMNNAVFGYTWTHVGISGIGIFTPSASSVGFYFSGPALSYSTAFVPTEWIYVDDTTLTTTHPFHPGTWTR
jgi:hypothetical protein